MKMMYGKTPIKSLNIKHYEMDTNDCTAIPSDLQAGVTCVAKGKKIVGTGKSFSFASYGSWKTNCPNFVPTIINTIQIGSPDYPVKMTVLMKNMATHDFTIAQTMAEVIVDEIVYPITVSVKNGMLSIVCDKSISIELFYGKDEYV